MTESKNTGVWEYLRIATPVLTTLGLFIVGLVGSNLSNNVNRMETQLLAQMGKIDDKLFRHLTNDEIHMPRSTMVDKQQFDLINTIRASQLADLKAEICDVKTLVMETREEGRARGTKQEELYKPKGAM